MSYLNVRRSNRYGAAFTDEAKAGLAAYQQFRKQHKGMPRAVISQLWREHKASAMQRAESTFAKLTNEEVATMLEQVEREQDPKYLVGELLRLSQNNPACFPYGLATPELRDVAKLQQALYRARGGVLRRRYRRN